MDMWDMICPGIDIAKISPDVLVEPNYITGAFHWSYDTVSVVHDLTQVMYFDELCTKWKTRLLWGTPFFLSTFFSLASRIIAVSQHTRKDLLKLFDSDFFKVSPSKVRVVHEGVAPHFQESASKDELERVKEKYGIPNEYVLCVSRQQSYKNLDGLVEAYRLLPDAVTDQYKLVLTGSFNEEWTPKLKGSVKDLIEDRSIVFTGFVDDEDLPAVYQGATLFCLPSKYEGFGLPLLEAMASNCPIASSDRASLPEVAGDAAVYFDPEDVEDIARTLEDLLNSPERRNELVRIGRDRMKQFSWEEAALDILSVCKEVGPT